MLDVELRRKVDMLWDKFWAGGLANPLTAIDQMNYLIFLKRLEDLDNLQLRRATARRQYQQSVFDGADQMRWSQWKHFESKEMFRHVQTEVFSWLRALGLNGPAFAPFSRDATFLIPKPSLLVEAVNVIDELAITDRNVDTQGDIYEFMLSKLSVAGQIGQFRTPRHLIRTMVRLVSPAIRERIFDPACGTGGFLIGAHQHLVRHHTSSEFLTIDDAGVPHGLIGDKLSKRQWSWLKNEALTGFDFDASMVRIAAMNLVLHGVDHPRIEYADTLGRQFPHQPAADVVLANPPFSGSVDVGDISDEFTVPTKKTELLFLELILHLLVPGGRAAVIVPEGVLFSGTKGHLRIREELVDRNTLDAVIKLPAGAFKPYSGVSTAILLFRKGGATQSVWMFDVRADGYSLDDKRSPVPKSDLPLLEEAWPRRAETDQSFNVNVERVRASGYDLSVGAHLDREMEIGTFEDPVEIGHSVQRTLETVQSDLAKLLEQLK